MRLRFRLVAGCEIAFLVSDPLCCRRQIGRSIFMTWTACRRAVRVPCYPFAEPKPTIMSNASFCGRLVRRTARARGIEDWRVTLAMMDNAIIKPRFRAYSSCELSSTPPLDLSFKGLAGQWETTPDETRNVRTKYRGPSFRRFFAGHMRSVCIGLLCCLPVIRSGLRVI